jgi:hypothetical protein
MRNTITFFALFLTVVLYSQDNINWDGKYLLQQSDF